MLSVVASRNSCLVQLKLHLGLETAKGFSKTSYQQLQHNVWIFIGTSEIDSNSSVSAAAASHSPILLPELALGLYF